MYKLIFFVPASHLEQVKSALFDAGAGQYQGYDQCCWQVLGTGQFRPLPGSTPFLGSVSRLETISEYKVELICAEHLIKNVLQVLLNVHPYELPAYEVYQILSSRDFG